MPNAISRSYSARSRSTRSWLRLAFELLPALLLAVAYFAMRTRESRAKPWQFLAKGGRAEFVRWLPDSQAVELVSGNYKNTYFREEVTGGVPIKGAYAEPQLSRLYNAQLFRWKYMSHSLALLAQTKEFMRVHAYAANGTAAAFSDGTRHIHLRDLKSGRLRFDLVASAPVTALAFSPDAMRLAVGTQARAEVWDTRTGALLFTLRTNGLVSQIGFSPRGTLVGAALSSEVGLWDARTGQPRAHIGKNPGSYRSYTAFACAPDERTVAVTDYDGGFLLYDLQGSRLLPLSGHVGGKVFGVDFSPDGKYLATASNGKVRLWNTAEWTLQRTLAVAPSPLKSSTVLAGGPIFTRDQPDPNASFIFIQFSPDSSRLAAQTYYGKLVIWQLR